MIGLTISATNSMQPTRSSSRRPYSVKIVTPLVDTALYTRPMIPMGAQAMTQRTAVVRASARLPSISLVASEALRRAMPKITAQARTPMKLPSAMALMGFCTTLISRVFST